MSAITHSAQSLAIVAVSNDSFSFGPINDTFGLASNQNTINNLNTLQDVVQHPQAELANLQQAAAAEAASSHDALGLVTLPHAHAANLHTSAFHLA
jgi:hypothetical protein